MIFKEKLCQKILDGTKTQTRRLIKEGDFEIDCPISCVFRHIKSGGSRLIWRENQTYAVQPGRGKKAIGRIGIIKIRKERLQDITIEDVKAEGVAPYTLARGVLAEDQPDPRWKFIELWNSIYPKDNRWEDDPEVWVLEFELAGD